jgi:hypothetical protein
MSHSPVGPVPEREVRAAATNILAGTVPAVHAAEAWIRVSTRGTWRLATGAGCGIRWGSSYFFPFEKNDIFGGAAVVSCEKYDGLGRDSVNLMGCLC